MCCIYVWPCSLGNYGIAKRKKGFWKLCLFVWCGQEKERESVCGEGDCQIVRWVWLFDKKEFEWVPDMGVGDGVLILLFYTAKGGVILFLKNLSSKLWQKRLKKMGSGTITRENFWGTKYDDGDYNSKMISAVIIYPCRQYTECWFHFSIQKNLSSWVVTDTNLSFYYFEWSLASYFVQCNVAHTLMQAAINFSSYPIIFPCLIGNKILFNVTTNSFLFLGLGYFIFLCVCGCLTSLYYIKLSIRDMMYGQFI